MGMAVGHDGIQWGTTHSGDGSVCHEDNDGLNVPWGTMGQSAQWGWPWGTTRHGSSTTDSTVLSTP